jgi:methionine-rich copper-binding protein CopC
LPLASALVLLVAGSASGHEELVSSEPAAGARLDEAPAQIVLTFSGEIRPDSRFVVLDPLSNEVGGGDLDLDVPDRNVLRGDLVTSDEGTFTIHWTIVSLDGHPQEGTVTFVVGSAEAPNTALASRPPVVAIWFGLLASTALLVALARRRARIR